MGEIVSFRMTVSGRVQGVGFRYFARQRAELHGVAGFVRNLPDGTVEVQAEGPAGAVSAFEADVRRGPSFGKVADATVVETKPRGFESFEIR
jgi:acylphosphatase